MPLECKNLIDSEQLKRDTSWDETTLDEEISRQAALYAWYGTLNSRAHTQFNRAETTLEMREAKVAQKLRHSAKVMGDKITEPQIREAIALDKGVIEARLHLSRCRAVLDASKIALKALEQKKDMLVQASATRRGEREGELRIKGEDYTRNKDKALKDKAKKAIGAD